ncbi:methylmalonyl-CoA mutase family protein [Rhodoplanes sp. Z2-YC6860]|uniref:methylmalonyl-CoA mutase family protein n=1 Tax=Rhodoplanes sp. Z2-YC6860 TaxID=674703 RepID=UPI00078ED9E0|nr:methylmalonyl-CoA mutase family protein [Rhodoplanes sp. Z2-YC6860]AMN41330.1 methylmalonyl-CoA mutase, small subunit [Rhodoplanes sp. Z2-YC6860]
MTDELPLAAEFPPASREDWLKLVRAALKDRPFERLIARTYDGIPIEPLYPRPSGANPVTARSGPWSVQARVDHPDPAIANAEALHELENGATALTLVFAGSVGAYGYGLPGDAKSVARVLEGVHLDAIAVELQTAEPTKDAADHVAALVKQRGYAPGAVNVRFGHDALGAHTLTGTLPIPYRDLMPRFGEHVASLARAGFKSPLAAADGRIVHNAGGSEVQELAYALAVAVAYLRALEGAGIALDAARGMIEFRLSADADQFLTVAKLRALRLLWARVEQACGLAAKPAFISAETAWRTMTKRDPWVNMLRGTIAAFAAGIGGADAVSVLPFTAALGLPDRFARRIARNTQLLLLEESNLAKVADPAAGSGGIEDLTDKLCRAAWALFQEIEAAGGAPAALEKGLFQEKVAKVRGERENAVVHRKDSLTGTSDYPLLSETPVKVLAATPVAIPPPAAAIQYPALAPHRLAEPFEMLRDNSDRALAATGARPKIFLANLGALAEFTARATFARNFFEAGGIEAIANDGFKNRDEMIAAFKASGAKLACLCSSDAVYESEAADAAGALANAGAAHIYLAGRPKELAPYKAAGVGSFIFAGGDILATLKAAHAILGLEPESKS